MDIAGLIFGGFIAFIGLFVFIQTLGKNPDEMIRTGEGPIKYRAGTMRVVGEGIMLVGLFILIASVFAPLALGLI